MPKLSGTELRARLPADRRPAKGSPEAKDMMEQVRNADPVKAKRAVGQQILRSAMRAARPTRRGRMSDIGKQTRVVKDLSEKGLRRDQRLFYKDPVKFLQRYDVKGFDDGSNKAKAASAHFRRNTRPRNRPFRTNARKASPAQLAALTKARTVRAANLAARRQQGGNQQGGFWW